MPESSSQVQISPYLNDASALGQPADDLFYSKPWLCLLEKAYGFKYQLAKHLPSQKFLIFTLINNLAGQKITSLPFSDYAPIGTEMGDALEPIFRAIRAAYPKVPILLKTRCNHQSPELLTLGKPVRYAWCHIINTENTVSQSSSFKRGAKKATKAGVQVRLQTSKASLSTFYQLYHQLRLQKFGSIPQPYCFFELLHKEFMEGGRGFVLEATHQKQVIASIIVLQHQRTLYYKFGASSLSALDVRPNNLLFDELIRYARQNNFEAINLGLSGAESAYEGLVRFKESMGGKASPITYIENKEGCPPPADHQLAFKDVLGSLTGSLVQLQPKPELTSRVSEVLYPYFA
jgi:hypothetical protein